MKAISILLGQSIVVLIVDLVSCGLDTKKRVNTNLTLFSSLENRSHKSETWLSRVYRVFYMIIQSRFGGSRYCRFQCRPALMWARKGRQDKDNVSQFSQIDKRPHKSDVSNDYFESIRYPGLGALCNFVQSHMDYRTENTMS